MNVIFLDFDGVLDTYHFEIDEDVEKKIKVLADICHMYDAKVVIEASARVTINEETMEIDSKSEFVLYVFYLFNKYDIDVIGRTPNVKRYISSDKVGHIDGWKEDEIRLFLFRHPEIEHYCVIDDDDLSDTHRKSDLDKIRPHLVKTEDYSDNPEEEGLLPKHMEEVGEKLKVENEVRRLVLKYKNKYKNS